MDMNNQEKTRHLLSEHFEAHPKMGIDDIFKFLHQSVFGCEHAVSSRDMAVCRVADEAKGLKDGTKPTVETLDGAYSRVHLGNISNGLSPETLGTLFFLSAKGEKGTTMLLEEKLEIASAMADENLLPFDKARFVEAWEEWKTEGYRAIHHSETFREEYEPAYRVISNEYIPFLPLFAAIDRMLSNNKRVLTAIEGGSASGKSTLGELLESVYDCTVFHMDDFFLRPKQRTPERLAEPGGNVDRERFLQEVLMPLSRNEAVEYRRFDCSEQRIMPGVTVLPKKLTIVEGAYSMHPDLEMFYDYSVFLNIDEKTQKKRIEKRNSPQFAKRFFDEWIPMENRYFEAFQIAAKANLVLRAEDLIADE